MASLASVGECCTLSPPPDTVVIFDSRNTEDYAGFRLPALIYHQNYILAFCEGRIDGREDSSATHIVMKRRQWQSGKWDKKLTVVANIPEKRLANPVPILDTVTNTIHLVYTVLVPGVEEEDILQQEENTQVLHLIKSTDVGVTWSDPIDITQQTIGAMDPVPVFFAPGPGHGIQMRSGRLVLQGNFHERDTDPTHQTDHSAVFLSDNNGVNWRPGGFVPSGEDGNGQLIDTSEATTSIVPWILAQIAEKVVELEDNNLCMNSRTLNKTPSLPRAQSFSSDGGETFGQPKLAEELIEPHNTGSTAGCAASMIGFPAPNSNDNTWVLFSNPASDDFRLKLSIRLSKDGCQTWSDPWTIWSLASAYSDMVYLGEDGGNGQRFAILYERGKVSAAAELAFTMFTLDDVLSGIKRN